MPRLLLYYLGLKHNAFKNLLQSALNIHQAGVGGSVHNGRLQAEARQCWVLGQDT